jgi:hypothetical protein
MIQLLASRYNKHIAYVLSFIFYLGMVIPAYGKVQATEMPARQYSYSANDKDPIHYSPIYDSGRTKKSNNKKYPPAITSPNISRGSSVTINKKPLKTKTVVTTDKVDIDGPSQPEMSSFKPAGTNDMVNLFTGDFSYNIPLLDVGGYPVNIFYDGGIGMEQEASWVGLGWNINPGNVNRNMRGVPDDFNGTEKLIQEQNMKKNITWGVNVGAGLEIFGFKKLKGNASVGFSVNNHLGPAIEIGGNLTADFNLSGKAASEKAVLGGSIGLGLNLSSRSGLSISPSVSLTASANRTSNGLSSGKLGLSTSYNSRSGIKALQLTGQMSYNIHTERNSLYVANDVTIYSHQSKNAAISSSMLSSSISFTKPSYVPSMRASVTNSSGSGRFQLGPGSFGIYPSFNVQGYGQVSTIEPADRHVEKPMVGYIYVEKAKGNRDAVMDFTRFNDQEVTPKTTIISVPQYAFDVFSIQGEGTGGTIRAYRNDNGYVRDNYVASKDKSWSAGADVGLPMPHLHGLPGHWGGNFAIVKTPSTVGEWQDGNKLRNTIGFRTTTGATENVYFRNPGENSVLNPNQYDSIGGTDLVRFKLGGTKPSPTIEPKLERLTASGAVINEIDIQKSIGVPERKKRTQVTNFFTAKEAKDIGLDKKIKNFNAVTPLNGTNKLNYIEIDRSADFRKEHHISQINVTEADGKRYIYGIPVYNTKQIDYSFTVGNDCNTCDKVPFSPGEEAINSTHINSGVGGKDGYVQKTETPPYAHSFLLSGLLSPDYVDVNGDGITEDDLGGAVKFNYTKTGTHKWRTPLTNTMEANSNPGNLSERKDDKGIISYGERESWYLHSIESKTMIAFFTLESRADGKGALNSLSGIDFSEDTIKRLKKIDLYNKADLKKNGLAGAKPVKTVHFGYNYSLCSGTPDNQSGGKLTLEKIWFTYNGQNRGNKNQYVFSYTKAAVPVAGENPSYEFNASDRWGNYKPSSQNPAGMKNRDYPYSLQDKTKADENSNAWILKKILLPSGGQLEVEYESDDYAFVQNKRAAIMSEIIGFSNSETNPSNNLFSVNGTLLGGAKITEHNYLFIKVPVACTSKTEVFERYLKGVSQIAVRFLVNMPKGQEFITAYATINDYGVYSSAGNPAIWIKMNPANGNSPLSQTAIEYLREQLPGQAFPGYDVSDEQGIKQMLTMLEGWWQGMQSAFSDIPKYLKGKGLAQTVQTDKSFVRLNDPDGFKYGGGNRVKKVILRDNWDRMTNQYVSVYGQEYDYSTTENFNGTDRTISSGVASYEPSIGGVENPFQTIVQIANEVPFGPTSYGAIEMPVMDAFFPAPVVGYSRVTVRSIGKKQNPDTINKKTRSAVGRQVTEFYTAKDFPVYYNHSKLDPGSDVQHHINLPAFLYNYARDSRALSQGFLVATNDMHGKMKSQSSYAENDPNSRINYSENFYRNTGAKGSAEQFDFVHNKLGGEVIPGNMGIDIELMTDTREFQVKSLGLELQAQVDNLIPPVPEFGFPGIWLFTPWPVVTESKNTYRAVTTTKVINYHAVLDSVVVIDKGSTVTTKNLVYDAETGQVVVNRTNNEFNKPIYSVNYPAYWAYSGMGLAYKNIDAVYTGVDFLDGRIISNNVPQSVFESGDELYINNPGTAAGCDPIIMASPGNRMLIWALDTAKNSNSLTNTAPYFIFIDSSGKPYSRSNVSFRIVRSGHRNMLGAPVASVALMTNPVDPTTHKLTYTANSKVINASAVEYKEKWQTDNDVFKKYRIDINPTTCAITEVEDCAGYLEKKINPYVKGLLGNFRGYRNMVFYGERAETNPLSQTNLPVNGFLTGFNTYWNFNNDNNLVPDIANTKWVWNTEATRFNSKGMELETKDALNIYTAAQYGYSKTLPTAIANNSRADEMAYEGFEDYTYNDLLNNSAYNICIKRHFDFTGFDIVSSEQVGFNAHSGKRLMRISNNLSEKNIPIATTYIEDYNLNYENDYTRQLSQPGGLYNSYFLGLPDYLTSYIDYNNFVSGGFAFPFAGLHPAYSNLGASLGWVRPSFFPNIGEPCDPQYLTDPGTTIQYIEITTDGLYNFSIGQQDRFAFNTNAYTHSNYFKEQLLIFNADASHLYGVFGGPESVLKTPNTVTMSESTVNHSIYLCKGIYKIHFLVYQKRLNSDCFEWTTSYYSFSQAITSYASLFTQNGCTFTKPLPAKDSMMNPTFSIPSNKKMVFSAWVRETNINVPTYTNNEVLIDFGTDNPSNVPIKPAGPIIEGWQRYEGYFTAPTGVSSMNLKLINNSGQPIYFDDIRIHPFNSNMKSYVYDPVNLRLTSESDANNYASFYEYDEEGTLIRTKVETKQGIKTVTESRSAKQKNITNFQ